MRSIRREKKALRRAREVKGDSLRDPVELALAGLAEQSRTHKGARPPEPPPSPLLRPVQTPLEVLPQRKVAGAEGIAAADMQQRIDAAYKRRTQGSVSREESPWAVMERKARSCAAND